MSQVTIFESRPGETQGRIEPSDITPPDGSWAFALGSAEPGVYAQFADGDDVTLKQDVDLTEAQILRATIILTTPDDVPDGWEWRVALLLDGVEYISEPGWAGKTRTISDIGINIADQVGVHEIAVRLTAEEI